MARHSRGDPRRAEAAQGAPMTCYSMQVDGARRECGIAQREPDGDTIDFCPGCDTTKSKQLTLQVAP